MLFPLHPTTPQCAVLSLLNNELLHFLRLSTVLQDFTEDLFTTYVLGNQSLRSECWLNEPTRGKFEVLWHALPTNQQSREQFYQSILDAQTIHTFFEDETIRLPQVPAVVLEPLKRLTTHLYTKTKELGGIKTQANSSIEQHYQQFITTNRSELCFLCGTSLLSQNRAGLDDDDQWRSDYDHLLCKDKYPVFSVHPGNFIPTCHICNSKAKGKRNLLIRAGYLRTLAFYPLPPLRESCSDNISLSIQVKQLDELIRHSIERPFDGVDIEFVNTTLDLEQKINVWDEVYQVPSRVKAHIESGFLERVLSDLQPSDFDDFKAQLIRHSTREPPDVKRAEWRFWWYRLYQFLASQTDEYLADIWAVMQWKLRQCDDEETNEVFES